MKSTEQLKPKAKAKAKAPKLPMPLGPSNIVDTMTNITLGMALVSAINGLTRALKEANPAKRRAFYKRLARLGK